MRNRLLGDSLLVETLDQRLASHGIPADLITIELTERSLLRPNPLVSASLAKLRAKGMAIWLDDCGTGFLLLSQLHPGAPMRCPCRRPRCASVRSGAIPPPVAPAPPRSVRMALPGSPKPLP